MTTTRLAYFNNQELPAWVVSDLKDDTGTQYDMSSGWTFTVTLARTTAPATALAIKSTGITASATAVTVAWSTTDWDGLEASVNGTSYVVILQAVRTSDGYSIAYRPASPPTLLLKAAVGTSAVSPSSYPVTVTAATVSVADTGGYYTGDDVEEVLAEIATTFTRDQTLWPWPGYDVLPRELATGTAVITVQKDKFIFRTFIAPSDMVVTGVQMASTATASAGLTLCRYGLAHIGTVPTVSDYTESRFTFLARTANDTTMFNTTNTLYSRSFSSSGGWPTSVRLVKGERYAVGYWISGTTAPSMVSAPALARAQVVTSSTSPWFGGFPSGVEAHTDLPPWWTGTNFAYDGSALAWFALNCNPRSTQARPYSSVVYGDSYCTSYGGWAGVGNATAGAPLLLSTWAGVGGETTTQVLARIATVTSLRPEVVIVSCGINDIVASASAATIQANLTTIYQTLITAGAKVIICTLPPTSSMTAPMLVVLAAVNTWLKALSVTNLWVSDTGNALTTGDGVTQNGSLYTDGVHPNFAGFTAMGAVLAVTIGLATA